MIMKTDQFIWDPGARILTAEASSLGLRPGEPAPLKLELTSPSTGVTGHFYPTRTVKDDDGDIQFWVFSSVGLPNHTTIHLFND